MRTANLANNAVTSAKVRRDTLTGDDIRESTLRGVASAETATSATSATSATNATNATNATHANAAGAVDRVVYVSRPGSVPASAVLGESAIAGQTAPCPAGTLAIGGGAGLEDRVNTSIVDSFPDPGGTGWTVRVDNGDVAAGHAFTVVAVCLPAGAAAAG